MGLKNALSSLLSGDTPAQSSTASGNLPQSDDMEIVFPPDHPLSLLHALWRDTLDHPEPLRLSLLSEDYDCMSLLGENLPRENQRLQLLLNDVAHARLAAIAAAGNTLVGLDEQAVIFVTRDEMLAWLFLLPAVGQGKELSSSQLQQALLRSGVTTGLHWKVLRQLRTPPQRHFQMLPIAHGTVPVNGQDGRIIDHYPRTIHTDVQVDELANADYVALELVKEIQENDIICEILPATPGIAGITVTGKHLPAEDGQPVTVPQGRNTRLSQDNRYLLAGCSGHIAFCGRNFQVKQVLHIGPDDPYPEWGVKFLGDVHVHGDLRDGAYICAMGTIQIDGVVGVCSIEAGESIILARGVQGHGRAVLHAQRSIYAKYLEHCCVYAQQSVQADCIISCEVYSNGTVKARTGRGTIIGGTVRAATEVSAVALGSQAERKTAVFLGGRPCEEAERMLVLQEIEHTNHIIEELSRSQEKDASLRLSKLRLNQCVAKMKLDKFDRDLDSYLAAAKNEDSIRLVCDTAYPGVTLTIYHKELTITQLENNCVIGLVGGRITRL